MGNPNPIIERISKLTKKVLADEMRGAALLTDAKVAADLKQIEDDCSAVIKNVESAIEKSKKSEKNTLDEAKEFAASLSAASQKYKLAIIPLVDKSPLKEIATSLQKDFVELNTAKGELNKIAIAELTPEEKGLMSLTKEELEKAIELIERARPMILIAAPNNVNEQLKKGAVAFAAFRAKIPGTTVAAAQQPAATPPASAAGPLFRSAPATAAPAATPTEAKKAAPGKANGS